MHTEAEGHPYLAQKHEGILMKLFTFKGLIETHFDSVMFKSVLHLYSSLLSRDDRYMSGYPEECNEMQITCTKMK